MSLKCSDIVFVSLLFTFLYFQKFLVFSGTPHLERTNTRRPLRFFSSQLRSEELSQGARPRFDPETYSTLPLAGILTMYLFSLLNNSLNSNTGLTSNRFAKLLF